MRHRKLFLVAVAVIVGFSAWSLATHSFFNDDNESEQPKSAALGTPSGGNSFRYASFDAQWVGENNEATAPPCHNAVFNFGWQPGKIGGTLARSSAFRAYYAMPVSDKTYASTFSASGTIILPTATGAGASWGWFNAEKSTDWRTSNSFTLRVSGDSLGWRMYPESGSNNFMAVGGGQVPPGSARFTYNHKYNWTISYAPSTANITVTDPDTSQQWTTSFTIPAEMLADTLLMNRFGIINQQVEHPSTIQLFIDTLVVDGAPVDLSTDPGWEGVNNQQTAMDCAVHGRQDFGASKTGIASSHPAEVGGTVWRETVKAWYGDVAETTLNENDVLYATGTINLTQATSDTDVFIGWFNRDTSWTGATTIVQRDVMYASIGGPSRVGFRFMPAFINSSGGAVKYQFNTPAQYQTPLLHAGGPSRHFSICYQPNGDGTATMTTTLDGDTENNIPAASGEMTVPAASVAGGLSVDSFGVFTGATGGHSVGVFLDDLRYTIEKGDSCG